MKKLSMIVAAVTLLGSGCISVQLQEPSDSVSASTQPVAAVTPVIPAPIAKAPVVAKTGTIKLFMIAMSDEGKSGKLVGCGDSVIPVTVTIPPTIAPLSAAFKALLALKSSDYGQSGLYNPSYADSQPNGSFQFVSASVVKGVAKIYLKGQISLPGECEDPRLLAQFEETAKQFSTVKQVEIYINGTLFDGSLKG